MATRKCMDTKCKSYLEIQKGHINQLIKQSEKGLKKLKQSRKGCKKECEKIDQRIIFNDGFVKNLKDINKKRRNEKYDLANCKQLYCNQGCKNTIFEDGDANHISDSLRKSLITNNMANFIIDRRKKMFGTKKSVLKDGFYQGLSARSVKKLKKEGSISGCLEKIK